LFHRDFGIVHVPLKNGKESYAEAHAVFRGIELAPCREASKIEDVDFEFGLAVAMIPKHVERWPTLGIERDISPSITVSSGSLSSTRAINVKRLVKFFPFRESN
jgi:hypothetical protein